MFSNEFSTTKEFIDVFDGKQKEEQVKNKRLRPRIRSEEVNKGARRMPRLSEAKKDVISCDKLR